MVSDKIFLLLVIITIISCTPSGDSKDRIIDVDTSTASIRLDILNDRNELDTLSQLVKFFQIKNTLIPISYVKNYLGVNDAEQRYSKCYSDDMFSFNNLTLLILRLSCRAGGICKEKVLVVFDPSGFRSQLTVQQDMSDESFSLQVDYEFVSDSLIQLRKSDKEFNDEGGTIKDTTSVEYFLISKGGRIEKSSYLQGSLR